jgi:hypothetical protein
MSERTEKMRKNEVKIGKFRDFQSKFLGVEHGYSN